MNAYRNIYLQCVSIVRSLYRVVHDVFVMYQLKRRKWHGQHFSLCKELLTWGWKIGVVPILHHHLRCHHRNHSWKTAPLLQLLVLQQILRTYFHASSWSQKYVQVKDNIQYTLYIIYNQYIHPQIGGCESHCAMHILPCLLTAFIQYFRSPSMSRWDVVLLSNELGKNNNNLKPKCKIKRILALKVLLAVLFKRRIISIKCWPQVLLRFS